MNARATDELDLAQRVLDLVGKHAGGSRVEAEVLVWATRTGLTRFANSFIHQHVGEETTQVTLRVADDGRVTSTETSDTSTAGLDRLVERTLALARIVPPDDHWPGVAPPADVPDAVNADLATATADPDHRAGLVREFVDAAPDLRAAGYTDTAGMRIAFANSAGQHAVGTSTRATLDGIHQTPTSAGLAHQTSVRMSDLDAVAAGARAAQLARDGVEARDLEPGRYEVVLSPDCVAEIVAYLAYYGLNAKAHAEGQSFAHLGEPQFDPSITLWDDATDPQAIGVPFDCEGTPKQRLVLVDGGTTAALAHDRRTAARAGGRSTGHAIPGGESWGAIPTNLFLQPGAATEEELIASVERGLYVTSFHYCRVLDPKTQIVTGLTRNGTFLVEKGEIGRAVTNLRFTQSFVGALAPGQVLGVGSRARFGSGDANPGMSHVPTLRLAEWSFTGGARG